MEKKKIKYLHKILIEKSNFNKIQYSLSLFKNTSYILVIEVTT